MYRFFLHVEGTDVNNVPSSEQMVLVSADHNFDDIIEIFRKKFNLVEAHIVHFRNLGKIDGPIEDAVLSSMVANNRVEEEIPMAKKKKTSKKVTKKITK